MRYRNSFVYFIMLPILILISNASQVVAQQSNGPLTVSFKMAYTNFSVGFPVAMQADISGPCASHLWYWGDGSTTMNNTNPFHAYAETGLFSIVLFAVASNSTTVALESKDVSVHEAAVVYISHYGSREYPYSAWETATPIIQEAVDAASDFPGTILMVSNGIYNQGAHLTAGTTISNRVVLDKPVFLQSANGPEVTIIQGITHLAETNIRCLYMGTGSCVSGFTIKDGSAYIGYDNGYGGGIFCENRNFISNCVIVSNFSYKGGGVFSGTINDSNLKNNIATCGAGASECTIYNCLLQENEIVGYGGGGGASACILYNSRLIGNKNTLRGSGAEGCVLYDCYARANTPSHFGAFYGCSIYFSSNMVEEPDYRLKSFSPCINKGSNAYSVGITDLDGNVRIQGGIVDMGAYEYCWTNNRIPADWLSRFGLPADGSADYDDNDGDGFSNIQEWHCRTDPTNSLSLLTFLSPQISPESEDSGIVVRWTGKDGASYRILRCETLNNQPDFTTVASNIPGKEGTMIYTDINKTNQAFYLITVE